ncbi:MAG: hypothetical protein HYT65_03635 [Candidatus Yanofskybacteria bacterium]|nr:hypothetical protein [Candidatus Yanofskybacteria bacterium]
MKWPREFLLEQSVSLVEQLGKHEKWNNESLKRLRCAEPIIAVGGNEADCAQISADTEIDRISTECSTRIILKIRAALSLISADLKSNGEHRYGLCGECGLVIYTNRLEAIPWADLCLVCKDKDEMADKENKGFNSRKQTIVRSRSVAPGASTLR